MALERIIWNSKLRGFQKYETQEPVDSVIPIEYPKILNPSNSGGDLEVELRRKAPSNANAYCLGDIHHFEAVVNPVQYYSINSKSG